MQAAKNAPKSQWAKPWYEQVNEFQTSGGAGVSDIFERNAQKKKELRKNGTFMYENTGSTRSTGAGPGAGASAGGTYGGGTTTNGSARSAPSPPPPSSPPPRPNSHHRNQNSPTSSPPNPPPRRITDIGGFSSSDSTSGIFERNAQKRDRDRRNKTGAYDPNQSALEDKLASLMKHAAEAEERYARLQRDSSLSKASLQQQNDALRKDAADARAKCRSLEEELVKAASKSEATTSTMSSEEKAMLGGKIASLRKEANDAKAMCQSLEKEVEKSKSALRREKGAMEEKIALAKARCESLEAALKKSKAEMTDMLSSHGKDADDEEKKALKAKIANLEKDLRSHVDVVQKYRKESQSLRREARAESLKKAGDAVADGAKAGLNAIVENMKRADKRAAKANKDEMEKVKLSESVAKKHCESLKEERNTKENEVATLKEALASSRDECRRLKAKMPSKLNAAGTSRIPTGSRANMMPTHHDASGKADDFASAVGMATEGSERVTAARNKRSRIPTGVSANMIHDTPKSIKDGAFSSAVGIVKEKSFEDMKVEVSENVSTRGSTSSKREGGLFRRASNQMHKKKTLVIAGSVALLFARSLLKVWIRGGLL